MTSITVIYTRLSQDRTGEAAGVARQERDCTKLADAKGWEVSEVLTDNDASATSGRRRPQFERLVEMVERGEVQRLVVWHLDRLVRKMSDLARLIEVGQPHRLNIACLHGVSLDLSDPTGVAVAQILTAIAGMETAHKANRQKAATMALADAGAPPARSAFGYTDDGREIDPVTGPVVRGLFEEVLAAGEFLNLAEMTRSLNARGYRTSTRTNKRTGAVSGGGEWNRTNVLWMLKNPRYAGIRTLDTRKPGEAVVKVEVAAGTWPPIVTREEFDAVQSILSSPLRRSNPRGTARRWVGGNLFLCGRCGEPMRTTSRGDGVRTYSCTGVAKHLQRTAESIDDLVLRLVKRYLVESDALAKLMSPGDSVAMAEKRTEAGELRRRADRLTTDYADGLIDGHQLKVASNRINARLSILDSELAKSARSLGLDELLSVADPGEAFEHASLAVQRHVIEMVCTITVLPSTRRGVAPFDPNSVQVAWKLDMDA